MASQRRARQQIAYQSTSHGTLIQHKTVPREDGGESTFYFQHPWAFLEAACAVSTNFTRLLQSTLDRSSNVLSIAIYTDEISPGQQLTSHNPRKTQTCYWGILEYGWPRLSCEHAWNTLPLALTGEIEKIPDTMAFFFKLCLKMFLGDPVSSDLRNGILLRIPSESSPRLVRGTVAICVQDERAHKVAAACKGAAALKLCALCSNVVCFKSECVKAGGGKLVSSAECDVSKWIPHTNDTLRAIQLALADEKVNGNASSLAAKQTRLGFNLCPDGMLPDPHLNLDYVNLWAWDWMHCYCCSGIFISEVRELFARLKKRSKFGPDVFDKYLQLWRWPRGYANGKQFCRQTQYHSPTGCASEQISVAPVLAKWLRDVVVPRRICALEVDSMLRLIGVLELLTIINCGEVSAQELSDRIQSHAEAQQRAYGLKLWIQKNHYSMHLPAQFKQQRCLISTFLMERKHRLHTETQFDVVLEERSRAVHCATPVGFGCEDFRPSLAWQSPFEEASRGASASVSVH